jgi:hypothetical protein
MYKHLMLFNLQVKLIDWVLVVIINDHRKLHCPLTLFPQKICSPYKKELGSQNTMAKDIRGIHGI